MGSADISDQVLARVSQAIAPGAEICVGFSGGLDSTVLLDILVERAMPAGYRVNALHVNHGLSPNAYKWVKFCERFCANHGVALTVEEVSVDSRSPLGLEAAARMARYAVYSGRSEPYIALAHQLGRPDAGGASGQRREYHDRDRPPDSEGGPHQQADRGVANREADSSEGPDSEGEDEGREAETEKHAVEGGGQRHRHHPAPVLRQLTSDLGHDPRPTDLEHGCEQGDPGRHCVGGAAPGAMD